MTTRLALYNEALSLIGERALSSLTENREPRRELDRAWDAGAVRYCLEKGLWQFAIRTVKLEYSPSVETSFGFRRGFGFPEDFVRLAAMATDEYFQNPLLQYRPEAGYWYADQDEIYVSYVSDDTAYGNDTSLWPGSFAKWVAAYLAEEICPRLTTSGSRLKDIQKKAKSRLSDALSKDAMEGPTRFPPPGSWVSARGGRWDSRGDRRGGGGLIG